VRATGDLQARAALEQIDGEDMVDGAAALVEASRDDPDAAITGAKRIGDLEAALDDVEAALEWPERVKKAEDLIAAAHEVVDKAGAPDDVTELRTREAAVRDAIATKDASLLERRCTDLAALVGTILDRTGLLQLEFFDELKGRRREMTDQRKADRLFDEGDRAIATHQITVLKNVNRQLNLLLPQASRAIGDDASTVA
jgi:molecular chaperone DnaK